MRRFVGSTLRLAPAPETINGVHRQKYIAKNKFPEPNKAPHVMKEDI
jgi:hypothetical protein